MMKNGYTILIIEMHVTWEIWLTCI